MNNTEFRPPEVVSDLDVTFLLDTLLRRRWIFIAAFLASLGAGAAICYSTKPLYTATTLILIDKEDKGSASTGLVLSETKNDDYYQTQYMLLRSRSLLKTVHASLELEKTAEFAGGVSSLVRAVAISPVPKSRLVNIMVNSYDPVLAARVSNAISQLYVAQNLENKLFISKDLLQTLQGTQPGNQEENYQTLPAVVNNGLIQGLKGTYSNMVVRSGELSSRYTAEHPQRVRLEAEMKAIRARIKDETAKAVQSLKVELSGKLLGNNVRIVDPAEVPLRPIKPNKPRIMQFSAALGLLLGGLLAFALDTLDQTIRSQEDVEQKLGLPFLGAVPKSAAFTGLTSEDFQQLLTGSQSFTGESFKNIRTMLGFAGADRPLKRLLVTSTVQGEGKTFMSINLALVFAQLGQRVLLIEGDLRRPNLHKRFGLSREAGLSHYLAHGKTSSDIEKLVQNTATPMLKVITCGAIPPNPSELLSTPRLKTLLSWASENFDQVLIDGTPVFPISDALLWSREVDGAIFVAKFGGVNLSLARRAREKLQEGGLHVAGAVINQVTARSKSYYGDYYYQYHYYAHDEKPG